MIQFQPGSGKDLPEEEELAPHIQDIMNNPYLTPGEIAERWVLSDANIVRQLCKTEGASGLKSVMITWTDPQTGEEHVDFRVRYFEVLRYEKQILGTYYGKPALQRPKNCYPVARKLSKRPRKPKIIHGESGIEPQK